MNGDLWRIWARYPQRPEVWGIASGVMGWAAVEVGERYYLEDHPELETVILPVGEVPVGTWARKAGGA